MTEMKLEELRSRFASIEARRIHYERKGDLAGGMLPRHENWRLKYLSYPYLLGTPDERVAARFRDVYKNTTELGSAGKIGIPSQRVDDSFMQVFTHLLEEFGSRGGVPRDVIRSANAPIARYFQNGEPIAMRMFSGYTAPLSPFFVKYGSQEFLEPMLRRGNIRICPASFYNSHNLIESVRDDEAVRTFYLPTFRERMAGDKYINIRDIRINLNEDDIEMRICVQDYYLLSLCDSIYYRLPTDFDADAALIIKDPGLFRHRVISAFSSKWPDWKPLYGRVIYYDPYLDHTRVRIPEMSKHFGYAYQRESRIVFRPPRASHCSLQPEYLTIGPMTDYADLVCA